MKMVIETIATILILTGLGGGAFLCGLYKEVPCGKTGKILLANIIAGIILLFLL